MRPITASLVFSFNEKWPLLLVAQLVNDYTETNNMKLHILQTMKRNWLQQLQSTKSVWNNHLGEYDSKDETPLSTVLTLTCTVMQRNVGHSSTLLDFGPRLCCFFPNCCVFFFKFLFTGYSMHDLLPFPVTPTLFLTNSSFSQVLFPVCHGWVVMSTAHCWLPAFGSGFYVWHQADLVGLHWEVSRVVFLIVILSLGACVPLSLIGISPQVLQVHVPLA